MPFVEADGLEASKRKMNPELLPHFFLRSLLADEVNDFAEAPKHLLGNLEQHRRCTSQVMHKFEAVEGVAFQDEDVPLFLVVTVVPVVQQKVLALACVHGGHIHLVIEEILQIIVVRLQCLGISAEFDSDLLEHVIGGIPEVGVTHVAHPTDVPFEVLFRSAFLQN